MEEDGRGWERTEEDFLTAHRSLLSIFSFPFSVLIPLCGLESAHARHSLSKLNSALAYSQISVFRFHLSVFGVLHCAAVQASVLGEQDAAIYADDFAVGKGCLEGFLGTLVLCLVLVEGEQYGTVHY